MTRSSAIGYVLNAFPVVSETFILNELRAMEAEAVPVVVLPLTRLSGGVSHAAAGNLRVPVVSPPPGSIRRAASFFRAHVAVAFRHPLRYAALARKDLLRPLLMATRRPGSRAVHRMVKRMRLFVLAGWIADTARRRGITHLHAHYAKDPLEVSHRASRLTGPGYSFAAHAKDLFTTPPSRLARRLHDSCFGVVCHRAGADYMKALAQDHDLTKIVHVPHGIDLDLFHPLDRRREPGLILAVGRLTPKKGFVDLVSACAMLRDQRRSFRCVLLGCGREEASIRSAIRKAGLEDRFEILPFTSQERLRDWYARASILAVPAKITPDGNRDGIPNVLMEAMACALPAVATRVGGIPEVLEDGTTGLLVPPGDPVSFSRALRTLLDDPALAERMRWAAADSVKGCDFRAAASPLVQRFRSITKGIGGPTPAGVAERTCRPVPR